MAGVVAIGRMCDHPMVSFGLVAKLVERQVTLDTEDPDEKYHRLCREHEEEVFNPIKRARARARERKRENRNHRRLLKLKVILERYSEWATVIDISSTDEFKEWFKENQHWYKFNERDLYEDPDDLLAVPSHFGAGSAAAQSKAEELLAARAIAPCKGLIILTRPLHIDSGGTVLVAGLDVEAIMKQANGQLDIILAYHASRLNQR